MMAAYGTDVEEKKEDNDGGSDDQDDDDDDHNKEPATMDYVSDTDNDKNKDDCEPDDEKINANPFEINKVEDEGNGGGGVVIGPEGLREKKPDVIQLQKEIIEACCRITLQK